MILFIAPDPHKGQKREGFLQRVMAIDEIFGDSEKLYFDNLDNDHDRAAALINADLIYVHSIYNATKIIEYYGIFGKKIVTDLHGVVPEEQEVLGSKENADLMQEIEERVFSKGKNFVVVTNSMKDHFIKKYPKLTTSNELRWILLPIFNKSNSNKQIQRLPEGNKSVVYAGGSQPWQKPTEMVQAINKAKFKYHYAILTPDPTAFSSIKQPNTLSLKIQEVDSNEVTKYYQKSDMGFVLRDDIVVNRVACPTKLIEYLANGVVPIVDSPRIGDFYDIGYRYVTLDHFVNETISRSFLESAAKTNYKVLEKILAFEDRGSKALIQLSEACKKRSDQLSRDEIKAIITICEKQRVQNDVLKEKIADLELALTEEQRINKNLNTTINDIHSSKQWKVTKTLFKPYDAVKSRSKN